MKYLQFAYKNSLNDIHLGYIEGRCVVDINATEKYIPNTMLEFLQKDVYLTMLKEVKDKHPTCSIPLKDVILKAPIQGMDKIICIDVNYKDYCEIHKIETPTEPIFYSKFSSTIIGPNDPLIIRMHIANEVDWQVELCLVISKESSNVSQDKALRHVFGCTIAQNISARDWQKEVNDGQFLIGKSMDTFCPIGPWIVSLDEIGDLENLDITCMMNGVYKQKSNTSQLIFSIPKIIERLTSVMTLLPGDLILTGTPGGVGMYSNPPEFLRPGDVLRSEIQKIGYLENVVKQYVKPSTY